jgi:proline iminopeptidase
MYPNSTDAVIYDCPMWNTLLTSKTIASVTLPYFNANEFDEKVELCQEILGSSIPKEAFEMARSLEMDDELRKFCHVIDSSIYNEYFANFIPKVDVPEQYWYKYINFAKMLLAEGDFYDDYLYCLAEIKKPSLLIVGEYDMTCRKDQQEWFCEHSANGQFIMLEKSAHLSWIQSPQKYTDIIFKFMDGINNKNIVRC